MAHCLNATLNQMFKEVMPNLVTYLDQTPTFEYCKVRCSSKSKYQKDIKWLRPLKKDWITFSTVMDFIYCPRT